MSRARDELQENLVTRTHEWIRDCGLDIQDIEPFIKREILSQVDTYVKERETNAVAWTVGVIDDLHIHDSDMTSMGHPRSLDATYKGMKNTIRDRYKAETGIDPAPNYPIKADLQAKKGKS